MPHRNKRGVKVYGKEEMDLRRELANLIGACDVGIGDDLANQTKMEKIDLLEIIMPMFKDLIDGGANVGELRFPDRSVRMYLRRRGPQLDVGTRLDFEQIGWKKVCDLLDQDSAKGQN